MHCRQKRHGRLLMIEGSNYGINNKITIILANQETFIDDLRPVLGIKNTTLPFFMIITPLRHYFKEETVSSLKFKTKRLPNLLSAIEG